MLGKSIDAVAMVNAGLWHYYNAETPGTASYIELGRGKKGVLYSDGSDNYRVGVYGEISKQDVEDFIGKDVDVKQSFADFESGKGWYTGAFGAIIENGVVQTRWEEGHPDRKTARNILVEFNDGTMKLIQNYGHHTTEINGVVTPTRLDHQEMINLLRNFGLENIKIAFSLDAGGSNRMYTKDAADNEVVTSAYYGTRYDTNYLAVVKRSIANHLADNETNVASAALASNNESTSLVAPNTGVYRGNLAFDFTSILFGLGGILSSSLLFIVMKRR